MKKWDKPLEKLGDDDWHTLITEALRFEKNKPEADIPDATTDMTSSAAEDFDLGSSDEWESDTDQQPLL